MAESRAADYIAIGASRGAENFLAGLEKRRDEEKRNAKRFKSLVAYSEASGLLSKDQAEVMDVDSLEGFVEGKMSARNMERQDQQAALEQFIAMQKMQEFQQAQDRLGAITGFQGRFNDRMATSPNLADFYENPERFPQGMPAGDSVAAYQNALGAFPQVDPNDLNAFMSSYDKALPPATKQFAPTEISRKLAELRKAQDEGRETDAQMIQASIQKDISPSGMRIEFDDQGRPIITQGDISTPTTAFKTEAQKNTANAAATFATIDHVMANQKSSDWGIRGILGKVQDEWIAQAFPAAADPRRVDVQAAVSQLRQQMMAVLKAESQLSQKDKEEIMASLPKTSAGESAPAAMQKIARAKQLMIERVKAFSKQMGQPPPDYAAPSMTVDEITDAKEAGTITEAQAIDLILKYHRDKLPK